MRSFCQNVLVIERAQRGILKVVETVGLYEDCDVLTIRQAFILNTIYFGEINRCLTILMFLGTTNENVMYMRQDIENGTLS